MSPCIASGERSEERIASDIVGFVDGSLVGAARRDFDVHLETCASCRAELDEAREGWEELAALESVAIDDVASRRMRRRFSTWLASEERASSPAISPNSSPRTLRRPGLAALASGLAATLVAGLWLGARLERSGAETRALRDEVGALREMVALSMLRQPAAGERLEGVRYGQAATSEHGGRDLVGALFEVVKEDRNTNVRLAAVDALLALAERPGVGEDIDDRLYAAFSEIDSPLVQAAIAAGLLDRPGREGEARRLFQERLERNHLDPTLQEFLRRKLGPAA